MENSHDYRNFQSKNWKVSLVGLISLVVLIGCMLMFGQKTETQNVTPAETTTFAIYESQRC